MARTGGGLYGVLNQLRNDPEKAPLNLGALAGRPTREVIDSIVEALVRRMAMQIESGTLNEALSTCLEGEEAFDFNSITDEVLIAVMLSYVIQVYLSRSSWIQSEPSRSRGTQASRRCGERSV